MARPTAYADSIEYGLAVDRGGYCCGLETNSLFARPTRVNTIFFISPSNRILRTIRTTLSSDSIFEAISTYQYLIMHDVLHGSLCVLLIRFLSLCSRELTPEGASYLY